MNISKFQQNIGGNAGCVKKLIIAKKGVANLCQMRPTFK